MPRIILTFLALAFTAGPVFGQSSSAYLDSAAQQLVEKARQRRQVADLSVQRYQALSRERISVGLRGLRRDRLMYRREVAGRIDWTRSGPARIEVLGAREAIPVAERGVKLPSDLASFMPHLAFDPADSRTLHSIPPTAAWSWVGEMMTSCATRSLPMQKRITGTAAAARHQFSCRTAESSAWSSWKSFRAAPTRI